MIKIIKVILIFFYLFSFPLNSKTISVVNIDSLINNNVYYIDFIKNIEDSQKIHLNKFSIKEKKLDDLYKEIETSKIILDEIEINKLINEYNNNLNNFQIQVDNFNIFYQNQISNVRKIIIKEIIAIIEIYAKVNKIDLILDSSNYLIASNSINITNIVEKDLNNIKFEFKVENFEKN